MKTPAYHVIASCRWSNPTDRRVTRQHPEISLPCAGVATRDREDLDSHGRNDSASAERTPSLGNGLDRAGRAITGPVSSGLAEDSAERALGRSSRSSWKDRYGVRIIDPTDRALTVLITPPILDVVRRQGTTGGERRGAGMVVLSARYTQPDSVA